MSSMFGTSYSLTISLAKTSLSEETKALLPAIPWQQIYGLRNRIVHGYEGVSMQIVWDTVTEDIPALNRQLQQVILEQS